MNKTILFFGCFNPDYPRNSILRKGLEISGWRIIQCGVNKRKHSFWQNFVLLYKFIFLTKKDFQVLYLAERGQYYSILAWLLSKAFRKPLFIDFLYSRYDSQLDKKIIHKNSVKAFWLYCFDWITLKLGNVIICDTEDHKTFYSNKFKLNPKKAYVLPLGVDTSIYYPHEKQSNKTRRIIFFGSYTPSHGVDIILKAAHQLSQSQNIEFLFVGKGPTYNNAIELHKSLGLQNAFFFPWMAQNSLSYLISISDIVIGAVGETEKSKRSICFKEFQGMAMKKPVITAKTKAIERFFTNEVHLLLCKPNSVESLSTSILKLLSDEELVEKLSIQGYNKIIKSFSHKVIGRKLEKIINTSLIK